ncbi:hypothetical protein MKW98_009405 [Papaver atlanticum]|uniref:Uncharacterized protein n=1 Tax=Papaver atlanticum TaxID=357466 RepID=A0AAD4XEY5_9MAGN|nr:hypothetical protein MKW98_009405 [Papaver atlanticum]
MDLGRRLGRLAGSVVAVLTREDQFPYHDVMIHDYKDDLKNYLEETPRDVINDCILKLSRALVHSKDTKDVMEGIQKLEDSLRGEWGVLSPLQKREMLYLLAVGYYRDGDYATSLSYLDQCLEIAPQFNQALTLKKKFGSVLWFLIGGDHQYYLDMILDCERDIAEAGDDAPDEVKNENIIKLSWALVHTRQPEDVQQGIALLEAPLRKDGLNPLQLRDMLYVHALGHYYISRDFNMCGKDLCRLMEIAPDCWQGWRLYNTVFYRVDFDRVLEGIIFYAATVIVPVID